MASLGLGTTCTDITREMIYDLSFRSKNPRAAKVKKQDLG